MLDLNSFKRKDLVFVKRISKYLAGIICIVMLAVSLPVMAEPAPELTAEEALSLMDAVATQLKVYGRYDSITERSLYRGALEKILKDNPQMYETVLKGMLESLDKYSEYYSPEEAEALMESITGEIVGIGVTIDFSNEIGNVKIMHAIPTIRKQILHTFAIVSKFFAEFTIFLLSINVPPC